MEDNGSEPYDGVHVLLLGWEHEDDDLHGNKAMRLGLQKLENVFQGFFNYMTYSTWRIPIEASTAALNARLREFRDQYNHRGNLLIIYYAGHGATDANRNLSWLWYNNLQYSPRVEWNASQTLFLTDCMADVLLVIDCCNALSAVRAARTVTLAPAMLWAACSADKTTPQSGSTSFTENLIAELEDLGPEGMNVEDINTNIVIRMDQIQSHFKLLSRNAPHCVRMSLNRSHGSIRLKRLSRLMDEQLQNGTESSESASGRSERPRRTTGEQRRENIGRPPDAHPEGDAPGSETPSADVTESMKRLEAACLPAKDTSTPKLLQLLSFEFANQRLGSIAEAAENTCTWIHQNQTFAKWLSAMDPILWIQGKPGSGKSTLMKALTVNLSHTEHVKQHHRSQLAGHYFWSAGTMMQRSFEGLVFHLLYQIIEKTPRAGDYVVKQIGTDPLGIAVDVDRDKHLAKVLIHLFHDPKSPLFDTPWFFLVDGLDECGHHLRGNDLSMAISLIQDLSKAHGVKVIVASRPEAAIAESFGRAPFLRLQDLTANDIEAYVRAGLQDLPSIPDYPGSFEPDLERLAARIVRRAEGVFLWVVLVVRDIRKGLVHGDTMADLYTRLNKLPVDLDTLYWKILLKLRSSSSSSLSSRAFSLVFACQVAVVEMESEAKVQPLLSTTALYFALEMTTTEVIDARIRVEGPGLVRARAGEMSTVLQEATGGLIIPEERKGQTVSWPEDGNTISYLHKTAYDFLADFNVRGELKEQLSGDNFNPQLALLRAMVMQLKVQDHGIVKNYTLDDLSRLRCWPKIEQAMRYAEFALEVAPDEAVRLLQEMDRVMTYQLTKWSNESLNHHWSEFLPLGRQRNDDEQSTFSSFVTSYGLHTYLRWQYQNGFVVINKPGRPLLEYAIHPQLRFKGRPSLTVKCLLEIGADPNELVAGQTVYYRFLVRLSRYHKELNWTDYDSLYPDQEQTEITLFFRLHGADLSVDQLDDLKKGLGEHNVPLLRWFHWHVEEPLVNSGSYLVFQEELRLLRWHYPP